MRCGNTLLSHESDIIAGARLFILTMRTLKQSISPATAEEATKMIERVD